MSLSIELQNHISLNTVDHFKQANAHWNQHEVDYHKQVIILRKGLVENPTWFEETEDTVLLWSIQTQTDLPRALQW